MDRRARGRPERGQVEMRGCGTEGDEQAGRLAAGDPGPAWGWQWMGGSGWVVVDGWLCGSG
jgi:hypothetical protein